MGANFVANYYPIIELDELDEEWNRDVQQSLFDNGHHYSGDIGMLGEGFEISSFVAGNQNDAEEHIADEHSKWEEAMAVKVVNEWGNTIGYVIGGWCSS